MTPNVRDAVADDAESICRIYNLHVRNTIVTFEENDVPCHEMRARIAGVQSSLPWLVAERNGDVVGYAYATKWHERAGYRYAVQSTIYVAESAWRQGVGTALYDALLERLSAGTIRTAIGVVALPNPASVALHEKCGFRKVGHLDRVGIKFGRWVDVGLWQIAW